jgi:phage shock protein A
MGLWARIRMLVRARASAALDQAEDPREILDYAYAEQQAVLQKVRRGLVDVATSKRQLQQQFDKLRERVPQMEDQALRALNAGREDLARIALQRKQTALAELAGLERQIGEVDAEQRKLSLADQQLSARIEEFRTHRTVLAARYSAAEARVRVNDALTGVSGDLAELSMALGRAEEKTERLQARASAIDVLIENGTLAIPGGGGDLVERELRQITATGAVEDELAALRARVGPGPRPPALGSGE